MKSKTSNILLVLFALAVGMSTFAQKNKDKSWADHKQVSISTYQGNPDVSSGMWTSERGYGGIYMTLYDGNRRSRASFDISFRIEIDELKSSGTNSYAMEREAGTLTFNGNPMEDRGEGEFTFDINSSLKRFMDSKGIVAEDREDEDYYYLKLFLGDITQSYTQEVLNLGYDPSLNVLAKLGIHEVGIEYIKYAHQSDFEDLDLNMMAKWAIHGVSIDYLKGLKDLGYGSIEANDVKKFAVHGVTLKYIEGLRNAGYNLDSDDIRKFAVHGISLNYIQGLKDVGYGDLDADMIRKFAVHGISLNYIKGLKGAGYNNLDPDMIRKFAVHGISPKYIEGLLASNITKPEADLIRKAKVHGVNANFIDRARRNGHESTDLSDYIRWKVRGI